MSPRDLRDLNAARKKAELVGEVFARDGVDAMALSRRDWDLGRGFVEGLVARHALPVLAANLVCDGRRPFEGHRIVEVAGTQVGIVGLTDGLVPGCTVESPSEAWTREVQQMPEVDLVIGLLPQDRGPLRALGSLFDGDGKAELGVALVRSPSGGASLGKALMLAPIPRGKTLGIAPMNGSEPGVSLAVRNVDLSDQVASHGPTQARVTQVLSEIDASAGAPIPDDAPKLVSGHGPWIGSDACIACHAAEHAQWSATPHATAWETLRDDQHGRDPACVGCHVTGWEQPGGPGGVTEIAALRGVQCEACHGSGRRHVTRPSTGNILKSPEEAACRACHDGDRDGGRFDPAAYRPKVVHSP
ncbi:MAG: multiheme c-type cytochrome [Myxococcota bacterium]